MVHIQPDSHEGLSRGVFVGRRCFDFLRLSAETGLSEIESPPVLPNRIPTQAMTGVKLAFTNVGPPYPRIIFIDLCYIQKY